MTRFALGLKCGDFGARGFEPVGDVAPSALSSCKRDARAIEPSPTPHCRKNQRRVMSRAYSERRWTVRLKEFIELLSFLRDRLIEIQNRSAHHSPSCDFVQVHFLRNCVEIRDGDLHRVRRMVLKIIVLFLPK